jgi:uncharacterized protein YegP (UPF0339 family)
MRFVIRRNGAGKYWWRAVADNNEILAASELMNAKESCTKAINVVKREAATAPVHDLTYATKERGTV